MAQAVAHMYTEYNCVSHEHAARGPAQDDLEGIDTLQSRYTLKSDMCYRRLDEARVCNYASRLTQERKCNFSLLISGLSLFYNAGSLQISSSFANVNETLRTQQMIKV